MTQADVIIPVYGNCRVVQRCIESVLAHRTSSVARVLVIDDGSPDLETVRYLDGLYQAGSIDRIRHRINRGFVAAVNSGIAASSGDVLLLNSDTQVHGDWLDRLLRCAYADQDIGTVTPFSNNATICSYPFPAWRRGLPSGMRLADLDGLFARENAGEMADLPTGVGFCLLVRRACLDQIGVFDVDRFGRGYGEENDFCQRAGQAGWRSVVCADAFVYHEVGGSFGSERRVRARAAEQVLADLYPGYPKRIRDFIVSDRLGTFRRRVDAARASQSFHQTVSVGAERAIEKACTLAIAVQARSSDMRRGR